MAANDKIDIDMEKLTENAKAFQGCPFMHELMDKGHEDRIAAVRKAGEGEGLTSLVQQTGNNSYLYLEKVNPWYMPNNDIYAETLNPLNRTIKFECTDLLPDGSKKTEETTRHF